MGCVTSSHSRSLILVSVSLCTYTHKCKIPIKVRNKQGAISGSQNVTFQATDPVFITSKEILLYSQSLLISSCVLPGLDPRGQYPKKCQDNCFYLYNDFGILCCLFDGHGNQGEKVAMFCQRVIEQIFVLERNLLNVVFI
jgi:hypothetical protein